LQLVVELLAGSWRDGAVRHCGVERRDETSGGRRN
jgi:hypothetical protein